VAREHISPRTELERVILSESCGSIASVPLNIPDESLDDGDDNVKHDSVNDMRHEEAPVPEVVEKLQTPVQDPAFEELEHRLMEKDDTIKKLENELRQEQERTQLLAKEMNIIELDTASGDVALRQGLREALEKVHLLEIQNEHLTEACNAATRENEILKSTVGEVSQHEESRKSKEELLESIELIAKQENGLLRSIITQLKTQISEKIELHSKEIRSFQVALDKAHRRYQEDMCGEFSSWQEQGLEQEILTLGANITKKSKQEGWYTPEDPQNPLDQAIANVLCSISCPVKMELRKISSQGEYIADRNLKLIMRNGQVLVRQGTSFDTLANYMEALYEPFIHNINAQGEGGEQNDCASESAGVHQEIKHGRYHASSASKSPRKCSKSPRFSPSPPMRVESSSNEVQATIGAYLPTEISRTPPARQYSLSPPQQLPTREYEKESSTEDRPKRLKDRVKFQSTPSTSHRLCKTTIENVTTEEESRGLGDVESRSPSIEQEHRTYLDCVPLSASKSPARSWASPGSISPVSSSASRFEDEESPYADRIEHAIVLDADEEENRDRDIGVFTEKTKQSHHIRTKGAPSPRPRSTPLQSSHSQNKTSNDDDEEVRVRALKKLALRKQFEEHRKQKQQQTVSYQRNGGFGSKR